MNCWVKLKMTVQYNYEEMKDILKRAEYIKSFGSLFNFRLNRFQPKNKIVKIIKHYLNDEENIDNYLEDDIKFVYTNAEAFKYLNKGKETQNTNLELSIYRMPSVYDTSNKKFIYKLSYVDAGKEKVINKIDIESDSKTFWIDKDDNFYVKYNNRETFIKRKWQINSAGNNVLIIDGKTFSLKNIKERTTEIVDMVYDENY